MSDADRKTIWYTGMFIPASVPGQRKPAIVNQVLGTVAEQLSKLGCATWSVDWSAR
jgi:hypothetical protein